MIARAVLVLALLGAVLGCTAVVGSTEQTTAGDRRLDRSERPKPKRQRSSRAKVVVTVVNGDTHRRVRGARVTVGGRSARTNARGEAELVLRRRAPLLVGVRARNYADKSVRMPFQKRRKVTVRVYRPALQWRMYGADLTRTQAQTEIQVRPPFKVVWSRGIGSLIEFPAVVSEGVAYIGNYKGTIHAIEMSTGKLIWRYDPPGGKMASSPAIVGKRLVVHGMDGVVRVLRRRDGALLGAKRIGSPIESSPVVRGNVDYFGAWNGRVYALDLRTFRSRWVRRTGAKITSSAALRGRTLYIGNYGARVLALATGTGRVRWSRSVNGRIYGTPAVAAGRVFVPSSTGGSLTAFSTSGRYLWRIGTGSYVYSSPAVWAGRVYFGSYNGRLYAASARRGRVLWTVRAGGPISGAPVVVSGIVYAGHTRGGIVGADGRTGRIRFRFPHGEYVPVSGNGRRLLLHGYSRLYAVEPAAKPLK
jgi:outer membrane protein assembly factor BamB